MEKQLLALLSGLENVRCDTAAAAEGQADKEWAQERVWSEGRGCLQTLSSSLHGKGLRRAPCNAGSTVLPAPLLLPALQRPTSRRVCAHFPALCRNTVGGWVPPFPQGSW